MDKNSDSNTKPRSHRFELKIADLEQQLDFLETFLKEENISVIKRYPLSKIKLELSTENPTTAVSNHNFTEPDGLGGFQLATVGTTFLAQFTNFENGFDFNDNDELRFLNQASTLNLPNNFEVRCKVIENIEIHSVFYYAKKF